MVSNFVDNNMEQNLKTIKKWYENPLIVDKETIANFLQDLENKKAKFEKRTPAKIVVEKTNFSNKFDDEYNNELETIIMHFPNRNDAYQLYASFMHESNHAYEHNLAKRTISSKLDKNDIIAITHKIGFACNIQDNNYPPSRQYLFNINEIDSRIYEIKTVLNFYKKDKDRINSSYKYKFLFQDLSKCLVFYKNIKTNYFLYEQWLLGKVKNVTKYEKDKQGITEKLKDVKDDLNINLKDFIMTHQRKITLQKLNELLKLKEHINEIAVAMELPSEQRQQKLIQIEKEYQNKRSSKCNTKNIEEDIEL